MPIKEENGKIRQVIDSFDGGLNGGQGNTLLQETEVYDIQNFNYDIQGWLIKRSGLSQWRAALASTVNGMHRFYKSNGNNYNLLYYGTNVATLSDDGVTLTLLSSNRAAVTFANFITAQDLEIFMDGSDSPSQWDATTFQTLLGTPPTFLYAVYDQGILYGAGDPLAPSTLYYSTTGNVQSWPTSNTILIGQNDGSQIRGLMVEVGTKVIFKDSSIYTLTGNTSSSFDVEKLVGEVGTPSPRSIAALRGVIFFLGRERGRLGVYALINGITTLISQPIDPILNNTRSSDYTAINTAALSAVVAYASYPYYELCIPVGAGTGATIGLVFDTRSNKWTKYSNRIFNGFSIWSGLSDKGQIFAAGTDKVLYQLNQGSADNGVNINAYVKSKWYSFGDSRKDKYLSRVFFTKESMQSSYIPSSTTFSFDTDYAKTWANTFTLSASGWQLPDISKQFKEVSVQISDNSQNAVTLAGLELEAGIMSDRPA